jgi:hypothetical protein
MAPWSSDHSREDLEQVRSTEQRGSVIRSFCSLGASCERTISYPQLKIGDVAMVLRLFCNNSLD